MTKLRRTALALLLSLPLSACTGGADLEGDSEEASFGGAGAKADGVYTECELREVLHFVNRSSTTFDTLDALFWPMSTHARAARGIIHHRNGADGVLGTGDDDLFDGLDGLAELDDVPYVGPAALDRLVGAVAEACATPDLASRPFIDANTFSGASGGGWGRNNVELEATYTATGVTGALLREILVSTDDRGRTIFSRIRKNSDLEAFTYGYGVDEMPWDRGSHNLREDMPYVMLTIESGRFDPDEETGIRELSLGTDIMDDTYFDTREFDLLHRELSLRGRARWDDPTTIRRLLIAAKSGSSINDEGIKSAAKIDVRTDSASSAQVASLGFDVMRGMVDWSGRDTPVEAIRTIYDRLNTDGALLDIQGHQGVLLLEPMAHLRSTRSRLHFNEATFSSIRALHEAGTQRIIEAVAAADATLARGSVSGADADVLTHLSNLGKGLLDYSLIIERANESLLAAGHPGGHDATTLPMPANFGSMSSAQQVEERRIIAESISDLYHDFADAIDDADRILSDSRNRNWDDYADYYVAWAQSEDRNLARKTIIEPYLMRYESTGASDMAAFNSWCAAQRADGDDDFEDFAEVDAAGWAIVGNALHLEMYKVHKRIVEAAGTMARAMWFDAARQYYVPASRRRTGNFLIDTTDMTDMVSHEEWLTLTPDQVSIDQNLPAAVVFHSTLVNEVQIELGSEEAYLDRINELRERIDAGTGTAEDEALVEGARFIFDEYQGSLVQMAELKKRRVRRYLRRGGADDVEWTAAQYSKGQTALRILADEP